MKKNIEYKFCFTYHYLDRLECLQTGRSCIWSTSEIKATAKFKQIIINKRYALINILNCEIVDDREAI